MCSLIKSYTVCHSVMILTDTLFGTMVLTRFKDGRVHFRNRDERVKKTHHETDQVAESSVLAHPSSD